MTASDFILQRAIKLAQIGMACAPALCAANSYAQTPAAFVDDVPFITSPDNVTLEMLTLAGVKRGDHVIDLGSGDGRIVILAAKRRN